MLSAELEEKLSKIRSSPKLENQVETAIVLAAVEETLREQKSDFTPAAYFAALLSLIKSRFHKDTQKIDTDKISSAVVYLLNIIIHDVSPALLYSRFSAIVTCLFSVLVDPTADAALLRASIGCLEKLLICQNAASWAASPTEISPRRALSALLTLCVDPRPKVRKRAQLAVISVLKSPPPSPSINHPAANLCAESVFTIMCNSLQVLQKRGPTKCCDEESFECQAEHQLLHAIKFTEQMTTEGSAWPVNKLEKFCEISLQIFSLASHPHVSSCAFTAIAAVIKTGLNRESTVDYTWLFRIIDTLQPRENDVKRIPAWTTLVGTIYAELALVNPAFVRQVLPEMFERLAHLLRYTNDTVRAVGQESMIKLIDDCIVGELHAQNGRTIFECMEKVTLTVQRLFDVPYQYTWVSALPLIQRILVKFEGHPKEMLLPVLDRLGELHEKDWFEQKEQIDDTIRTFVTVLGVEVVLKRLPLNLTDWGSEQMGRAWLLPILRDTVHRARLGHFRELFLPVCDAARRKIEELSSSNDVNVAMQVKVLETIIGQVWSIFPGYCTQCQDVRESFDQAFAEQLCNLLYQRTSLRKDIIKGLQNLVESSLELERQTSCEMDQDSRYTYEGTDTENVQQRENLVARANLEVLRGLSLNMLAVLFNVYTQSLPKYRNNVLECINVYMSIAPKEELVKTHEKVWQMIKPLLNETQDRTTVNGLPPTLYTLFDLMIDLIGYISEQVGQDVLSKINEGNLLQHENGTIQKKAYAMITKLISKGSLELCKETECMILQARDYCTSAAKKKRLMTIAKLVERIEQREERDFSLIGTIIPEVVMSTGEVNEKARRCAFELLLKMGTIMIKGGTILIGNGTVKFASNSNNDFPNSEVPLVAPSQLSSSHLPQIQSDLVPSQLHCKSVGINDYFRMLMAGVVSENVQTVSLSMFAVSSGLYEFHDQLSSDMLREILDVVGVLSQTKNREIIRSILGFIKVCVTRVNIQLIQPRLPEIIPCILAWGKIHYERFKSKVRHIMERLVKRFGDSEIEKYTSIQNVKLVKNIRKIRQRQQRLHAKANN